LRQLKSHCDATCFQESKLDGVSANDVCKDDSGSWALNNRTTMSKGVAILSICDHESSVISGRLQKNCSKSGLPSQQIWSASQRGRELLGCCYLAGAVEGNF
jgi:hypothetical protein